jgi:hypothetical protein
MMMVDDLLAPPFEALLNRLFEHTHELFNEGYEPETVASALLSNAVTAYGYVHGTEKLAQQLALLCLAANDRAGGHAIPASPRH